jgi:hypothetical protein
MARCSELGFRRRGGGVWAGGSVSWRAAPSRFKLVARRIARHTEGASAAKRTTVPRQLVVVARRIARRMAEANGAKRRAAPSPLETTPTTAWRMVEAGAASTRAALLLRKAARCNAGCMGEASAAERRAAPSQPLQVPAVCTADSVYSARSPTMHRRADRNSSLVLRRHRKHGWNRLLRVRRPGGKWRVRHSLQTSKRKRQTHVRIRVRSCRVHNTSPCRAGRKRAQPALTVCWVC